MRPRLILALDTSAVISFDRLGYIEALGEMADVILTPAVVEELRAGAGKPGSRVPDLPWIQVRAPAAGDLDEVRLGLDAGAGERETIALGLRGTVVSVIDERPARHYAAERGVATMGTVALVVRLHERGLAMRTVEEDVALLRASGMYLTDSLEAWAVEQVQLADRQRDQGREPPTL